ncbi:MAG: hypothetical protein LBH40_05000 [Alphaproteobacteria bacterium]|jgi:Spy/CpxP family protein refolding chaperone|nr:hypothetical protein [Alphaproteobacteria bacterium]
MTLNLRLSKTLLTSILSLLIISFFAISLANAAAPDKDQSNKFFEKLKTTFTSEGGSAEGVALLEKSFNDTKAGMMAIKQNMMPLKAEMEKIMTAEKFDEKAFSATQAKIDALVVQSMNERNKSSLALLKQLNAKDRAVLAKIFNRMPENHQ